MAILGTQKSDLINPEVIAGLLPAYVASKSAYRAITFVDNSLSGKPGTTGTLVYWKKSEGAAAEVAEGATISYGKVSQDKFTYTVLKAVKGIAITDETRVFGLGAESLNDFVVAECGDSLAEYVDTKIANVINNDAGISQFGSVHALPTTREQAVAILDGLQGLFGDQWRFVTHITGHSKFTRLFNRLGMLKENSSGLPTFMDFGNKIWVESDAHTKNTAGMYVLAAFKPEAIGVAIKKEATMEMGRDMDTQQDKISATIYCGVLSLDKKVSPSDIRIGRALVNIDALP